MTRVLKAVAPTLIEPTRPKVMIFGPPGAGKTTFALDFPSVYFMDSEGGAKQSQYRKKLVNSGGMYLGPEQGASSFADIVEEFKTLATVPHRFKTVVVDSVSKPFSTMIQDEQDRLGDKDAFGASKKPAVRMTASLLNWVNKVDMNVILIGHEKDVWGKDSKGNQAVIGKTFDGYDKIGYELDLLLHVTNPAPNIRIARIIKSRFEQFPMGETFPWSFDEFASRYGQDIIAKDAVAITLATPEQVSELSIIINERRDGEELREKGLKRANADSLEELTTEQAAKWIAALTKKAA